jgi:DNA-binding protein HU-beta
MERLIAQELHMKKEGEDQCRDLDETIRNRQLARKEAAAELSKKDAEAAVNAVFDSVKDALAEGDKVSLIGFGTFSVKTRAARTGLNPRTKETIEIPESKVPAFKAGSALKDAVK